MYAISKAYLISVVVAKKQFIVSIVVGIMRYAHFVRRRIS